MVLLAQVFQMALLKSQLEGGGDDAGGDVVHGAAAVEHARVVEGGHQPGGDLEPSHAVTRTEDLGEGPVRDDVSLQLQQIPGLNEMNCESPINDSQFMNQ